MTIGRMSALGKPVPLWLFLTAIVATASITSAIFLVPGVLRPKPDFQLAVSPASPVVLTDNEESSTISIKSMNSFTGMVSLSLGPYPTASFNASIFQGTGTGVQSLDAILLGNAENLALFFKAFSPGNYTISLIATSGQLRHATSLFVIARSVRISAASNTITLSSGSSMTVPISLIGENGLSGNLSLETSIYDPPVIIPALSATLNETVSPSTVILTRDGTASATMTIQAGGNAQSWTIGVRFNVCPEEYAPSCVGQNFHVVVS